MSKDQSWPVVPTAQQAAAALSEHIARFAGHVDQALMSIDSLLEMDPEVAKNLDTSTRASMVNNHATGLLADSYATHVSVEVSRHGRMVMFMLGDYRMRVKKLDSGLRGQNSITAQQMRLYRQAGLSMDGQPEDITDLLFGYRLSPTQLLDSMWVVCPKDMQSNHWVIPVFDSGEGFGYPLFPAGGDGDFDLPIVTPKSASVKRTLTNE